MKVGKLDMSVIRVAQYKTWKNSVKGGKLVSPVKRAAQNKT